MMDEYHQFSDSALETRALTHASFGADNNEKLEWLGDAVLDFLVSDILYEMYPNMKEGALTQARARLVSGKSLAVIARDIGLPPRLRLSQGEERNGGRERDTILAGALEAYMAAVYLDGGLTVAQTAARQLFTEAAQQIGEVSTDMLKDSKTRLQEMLQKRGERAPQYHVLSRSMAQSRPFCVVECKVGDFSMLASADNQREAEQAASECVLVALAQ